MNQHHLEKNHIKQLFRSSIRRGTGEANLLMQQYPDINFSGEIIKACTKNFAYDGQCESSRGTYLFELIQLSKQKEKIRSAILNALSKEQRDTWTLTQLFDLSKLFALEGDTTAKDFIYSSFYKYPITRSDWAGYSEIIDLDGLNGLLFIARTVGAAMKNDPEIWEDDTAIDYFQKRHSGIDAMEMLQQESLSDPYIAIYLNSIKYTLHKHKKPPEQPVYKNILEEVLTSKRRFIKQGVSKKDLTLLARQLMVESNKENRQKLLKVFDRFKFPLNCHYILDIANGTIKTDKFTVRHALDALCNLKSKEIRDFGIKESFFSKEPWHFLGVLKSNYKARDEKLLADFAKSANSEHAIEALADCFVEIYRTNKTANCKLPLEIIYSKLNCAIHRYFILKLLIDNDVLSEKIKQEIAYDCYEDTRQLLY